MAATRGGSGPTADLESYLNCSICMDPFRQPKILPCVHSFCLQCLKSYLGSTSSSTSLVYRKKGGFPCPTCRQHVPVAKTSKALETWPDQLKDNFVMSSMLEAFQQQQQHPKSSPHSPTTDSGASESAEGTRTGGESDLTSCTCHTSPEMVCWDCAALVCACCALAKHARCGQIQKISVAGPAKRQEILEWLPALHERLTELQRRQDLTQATLTSLRSKRQTLQDQITQAANDAIQAIRLQEQKLLQTMKKEFASVLQRCQQRQEASSAAVEDLKSLKEALERCVLDKDVDLLRQVQCLEQRHAALTAPKGILARGGEREEEEEQEEEEEGEEEKEDPDVETGVFVPVSLEEFKSSVLVGVYHRRGSQPKISTVQSPVTSSAPTSPRTSDTTSWVHLQEGPVLQHRSRCKSLPSSILPLSSFAAQLDAEKTGTLATTAAPAAPAEAAAEEEPSLLCSPLLLSGQRGVTVQHTCMLSARAKGDKTEPLIRDLVVLNNGWLVATDSANRCVKCYFKSHPDDVKYTCKRMVLKQAPHGVCSVEGHLVAVTVPKERQLQMVMVRPDLVLHTMLSLPSDVPEAVWAVSSLGEQRLAVTTCPQREPGSVLILQVTGESVQCVGRYKSLVTTPLYMTVTAEHHIVTTDPTSGHVACITSDTGNAVFQCYREGKVMGVTCLSQFLLLVDQSPALYLLTNQGRCVRTIPLPKGKAGCSQPRAVTIATDNKIYISDDSGKIHIFSLRWQDSSTGS